MTETGIKSVGLFFVAEGALLLHTCPLSEAEHHGIFYNFPESHMRVWNRLYAKKYDVDFDYYPRGRILYRETDDTFLIYKDRCIGGEFDDRLTAACGGKWIFAEDEHYSCHGCLDGYCNV